MFNCIAYDDGISNSIRLQKITESRNITSPFDIVVSEAKPIELSCYSSFLTKVRKREKNILGYDFIVVIP